MLGSIRVVAKYLCNRNTPRCHAVDVSDHEGLLRISLW